MKKRFLTFVLFLILTLAACGEGGVNIDEAATRVAEEARNAAATAAAIATDIADGPDGDGQTDDEATPEPAPDAVMDRWAGTTADKAMAALGNATININGVETQSDGSGNFELFVPRADDGRYVINAELNGYVPVSQIHIGLAMETLTLEFQPVYTETFDPTVGVDAEDPSGTQITVGPNQLEDADGNEPTGDVTLNMYTYDLENEEMVGDMSGKNSDGDDVTMESEGAFYASFEDEEGTEYNLKDDATADISIPCDPRPQEILTVWSYDEVSGLWIEETPEVTEQDGRCGAVVSHFSYWNFDYEKRTPSCIKLEVDSSYLAANNPLNVQAVLQTNPSRVRDLVITQETNVLINLPNDTNVQFFAAGESTPFDTISSGPAWGGVGIPAHPYDACNGVATVAPAPEPVAGTLTGLVTDATTGSPIAGAQVCINGTNLCTTSDANGNYTIADAPAGDQTLSVTADGYIAVTDQAVTIVAGETTQRPIALAPELPEGELSIVLEWGEVPYDLDAYLVLPSGTILNWGQKGQLIEGAKLDLDDQNGFGPETFTISELNSGTYTYYVDNYSADHDDSNGGDDKDGPLSESGAVVKVYRGSQVIATYNVPTTGDGTTWNVFTLDGATGTLTVNNTLAP